MSIQPVQIFLVSCGICEHTGDRLIARLSYRSCVTLSVCEVFGQGGKNLCGQLNRSPWGWSAQKLFRQFYRIIEYLEFKLYRRYPQTTVGA